MEYIIRLIRWKIDDKNRVKTTSRFKKNSILIFVFFELIFSIVLAFIYYKKSLSVDQLSETLIILVKKNKDQDDQFVIKNQNYIFVQEISLVIDKLNTNLQNIKDNEIRSGLLAISSEFSNIKNLSEDQLMITRFNKLIDQIDVIEEDLIKKGKIKKSGGKIVNLLEEISRDIGHMIDGLGKKAVFDLKNEVLKKKGQNNARNLEISIKNENKKRESIFTILCGGGALNFLFFIVLFFLKRKNKYQKEDVPIQVPFIQKYLNKNSKGILELGLWPQLITVSQKSEYWSQLDIRKERLAVLVKDCLKLISHYLLNKNNEFEISIRPKINKNGMNQQLEFFIFKYKFENIELKSDLSKEIKELERRYSDKKIKIFCKNIYSSQGRPMGMALVVEFISHQYSASYNRELTTRLND